eukprot:1159394-Pelagomonas_calceolata.AAC.20
MGMKLVSKFNGMLMVKSKMFELTKGAFNITGPANTQKDSMKSHSFCTTEFAEVCMLPLCCLQLLSRLVLLQLSCPCRQGEEGEEEVGLAWLELDIENSNFSQVRFWSRVLPGTLQTPISIFFSSFMVEGMHGSPEPMFLLFLN